ncbi:hypothetical protein J5U21_01787 [Saccharolobus shibatae]|uniref:Uncharacterized protein n=1 Tax=Saccharolobus shibatae TaxID=2286 RepID=A0A8F5BVB8_9CREN|nr:hypothetical protein J5U21_01787 [Saccharolobus shibatae]
MRISRILSNVKLIYYRIEREFQSALAPLTIPSVLIYYRIERISRSNFATSEYSEC